MTKEQITYNGERIVSSINATGKTKQLHTKKKKKEEEKERNSTIISHHTQKSTQSGLKI